MENTSEELWLIGFLIDPDSESPDLYTLFFPGEVDEPLVVEDYIVFFVKPETAAKALKISDKNETLINSLPKEVDLICEVAGSLYIINYQDIDPDATIVNFLNILLDLIKATGLPMPEDYRRILYTFADHLTFNREVAAFFTDEQISRTEITDAILWCIGAVVSKSKLVF